jgi:phosphatidylserine decarboxylase
MISVTQYIVWSTVILFLCLAGYYAFWRLYFLRDPKRSIPPGNNLVSPADGVVISVKRYDFSKNREGVIKVDKGIGKIETLASEIAKKVLVISIFMSPFDVHVNRAPCHGRVVSVKHTKGKFYNARNLEKSLYNEKNEFLISTDFGRIKVIQIAGFLARRIESFVRPTQELAKGQRIGLINLGSQVTMILPSDKMEIKTKIGKKVKAGSSIIAGVKGWDS